MQEIDKLKKKRSTLRTLTTKLITKFELNFNNKEIGIEEKLNELTIVVDQLIEKSTELKGLNREIENVINIEEVESEITSCEEYNEKIISCKSRLARFRKQHEIKSKDNNADDPVTSIRSGNSFTADNSLHVKLPKIALAKFYGDPGMWTDFWNQYSTSIHDNQNLNNVQKFIYLKSLLGGVALSAIQGFAISSDNYTKSLDLLKERFGRQDIVINTHMNKLLNLEPVRNPWNIKGLRNLYDQLEINIRSLESLKVDSKSFGHLLVPIILKVIPETMSLEYNRKRSSSSEFNVRELIDFIKSEVECREANSLLHNSKNPKSSNLSSNLQMDTNNGKYFKSTPTTAAFSTTVNYSCCFCKGDHDSFSCEAISASEKRSILKNEGRCNKCFRRSHLSFQCKSKVSSCRKCKGKNHHESICFHTRNPKVEIKKPADREFKTNSLPENPTIVASVSQVENEATNSRTVILQTCEANVHSESAVETANILFDTASMRSFISKRLANRLHLPVIRKEHLLVYTFGTREPKEKIYDVSEIKISNIKYPDKRICLEVLISDNITNAILSPPDKSIAQLLKKNKIYIPNLFKRSQTVDILIGADSYWQIHGGIYNLNKGLFCIETLFGICISGVNQVNENRNNSIVENLCYCEGRFNISESEVNQDINAQLRRFWEVESMGIRDKNEGVGFDSDTIKQFERDIKFENGRYTVKLPFKENVNLSNNFNVARGRLFSLAFKFKENPTLLQNYEKVFEEQVKENIIEEVTNNKVDSIGPVYYMPHHPIIRSDKETTKFRVVYDASAKDYNCLSLNDNLLAGPNLNPNILNILLKFREYKIGIISDIEHAFLSVAVSEAHKDCQRFLWFDHFPSKDIKVFRSNRVTFGVKSSPFLLAATIKHHIHKYKDSHPVAYSALNENLYVDDFICGADTVEKALELSKLTKSILNDAGMNLRKWKTNSSELRSIWKKVKLENLTAEEIVPVKVLGIIWNTVNDEFRLDVAELLKTIEVTKNTKRSVLRQSCKLFDPIGFLSPFTIRIKILLQEIWESGVDWDQELPEELGLKWKKWCLEIPILENLTVPRCYIPTEICNEFSEVDFHIFCDASEAAFGAIAYMRYKIVDGKYGISFITSKARVAPVKKMSLPRLELMATVVGARILETLREVFQIRNNYTLWSDSTIALSWIRGDARKWKPFVCNRVCEIQNISNPQNWNHCKGLDNPADIVSRGCTADELVRSEKYWKGPEWLKLTKENWPNIQEITNREVNEERRSKYQVSIHCAVEDKNWLSVNKYSSLQRLYRVTAWVKRFLSNTRKKREDRVTGCITAEELEEVEEFWIRRVQSGNFNLEIESLKKGNPIPKDSKIRDLNPFLNDKGILLLGGRLQKANVSFEEKHPIILPSKNKFSELIVKSSHERILHSGVNDTLAHVRERFWIPKARQFIKSIVRKCIICKRYNVRSGTQIIAPLPGDRIGESPPFTVTGLDFAGPLYVKHSDDKYYILICTCAVTRALHLELVTKMSTEVFLLAFRRFISRRGLCSVVYSDNAKSFKRAELELKNIWNIISHPKVKDFYSSQGIKWKYIVEKAAWWGGFYERLVRSVKTILRKVVGRASLTNEELETVLVEIESVINSRPITFVHSEPQEPLPLSPAHFLIGRRLLALPAVKLTIDDINRNMTRKMFIRRFNYRENILNRFWLRWKKDYLLNLKSAHLVKQDKDSHFKEGDIVLINEEHVPRNFWKLGKVTKTFIGRDNKVRSCELKTEKSVIRRPVQLLYNLELQD